MLASGGGGCRSQVLKMRRTVKNEKEIEKKEKKGGRNSSPGDQSGAETPQSLAELTFFSRWLFRVTCFCVGSYGKLSSWDLVFCCCCVCVCVCEGAYWRLLCLSVLGRSTRWGCEMKCCKCSIGCSMGCQRNLVGVSADR